MGNGQELFGRHETSGMGDLGIEFDNGQVIIHGLDRVAPLPDLPAPKSFDQGVVDGAPQLRCLVEVERERNPRFPQIAREEDERIDLDLHGDGLFAFAAQ